MDEKYIKLLINKCTNLKENKILFISYHKEIKDFIDKLVEYVKSIGVEDIYLDEEDIYKTHDILKSTTEEEINNSNYFDKSIWDEYAKKKASFLMFETEYPGLMDDIDSKLLALASKRKRETKPLFRKMEERCEIPWCIAAYPGKLWAEKLFKEDNNSYQKLKDYIYKICMIDKNNPDKEWDKLLTKNNNVMKKLNNLNLEKLIYQNKLGTNLEVYLPNNYLYSSAKDRTCIVNMPSYEVFTSPIYNKTNGIVYASKPLSYNGGLIDNFWIKFKNGKVIDYDAKVGKELLKEIIDTDNNSCYLGECALVEKDSPIEKLNINFNTTLIDENASCHLALGAGFPECIKDGLTMKDEELLKKGINISKQHVDFMIGTSNLKITGYTKEGKKVDIFENGKFTKEILNNEKNKY